MAKMSKKKETFMENIKVEVENYQKEDAEQVKKSLAQLGKKYIRSHYKIKERHIKETLWILRDVIDMKNTTVCYLDGEIRLNICCTAKVVKNGRYMGLIFINNIGHSSYVHMKERFDLNANTVHEYYKKIRAVRNYIKSL